MKTFIDTKKNNVQSLSRKRLMDCINMSEEEVLTFLNSSYNGISQDDVDEIREKFGNNVISKSKKISIFKQLFFSFFNAFSIVLLVLAVISFLTNVVFSSEKDPSAAIIIFILVFLSGVMHFLQETRSDNATKKLNEMVETVVSIIRKGQGRFDVSLAELVVGDIVYLAAGDMIPADMRIIRAKDLFVSQSSLTGESIPVEKFSKKNNQKISAPLDSNNLVFMGSNIISGSAEAIVVAVGDNTIFGSIAKGLVKKKEKTNFEKGISSISKLLIRSMSLMVIIIFLLNGFTKGNWLNSLLFALSIAVGLTPEMLPMIVTTNLSRGAVNMSKKKVIVKNLNSIQNFGAMDVLCTDKTGTLTQDQIVLEYYLDINGESDKNILKFAFLNSYHQTGLRNLMDLAIIKHASDDQILEVLNDYKKIDEIPFDFSRRRMSVIVEKKGEKNAILITKGAIEEMLGVSKFVDNGIITKEKENDILKTVESYNKKGLRVIGISIKELKVEKIGNISIEDESDMKLIGYLAFLDPPKSSAHKAINSLYENGVAIKVLTGDNYNVTQSVCNKVGIINSDIVLLGNDIDNMTDLELSSKVEEVNIFAKLSPMNKARIVSALRQNGHVVGFMGDGINDASAMKTSDVGISVDTAVDIAKESANIILLEKDLNVLYDGVIAGRIVYGNIIKYIKMTISSNFGNMFSVLFASIVLSFLPMLPIQILLLNLINDIVSFGIPWDNVDEYYLKKPRNWNTKSIGSFMIFFGLASSLFDITTFMILNYIICPNLFGSINSNYISFFQTSWFIESLWTQTLVMHLLRTSKLAFVKSNASINVYFFTLIGAMIGTLLPYTFLAKPLGFYAITYWPLFLILALTMLIYLCLVTGLKIIYIRKHNELL